jgi:hypothetical protein
MAGYHQRNIGKSKFPCFRVNHVVSSKDSIFFDKSIFSHAGQREKKAFFHAGITFFHAGITFFHAGITFFALELLFFTLELLFYTLQLLFFTQEILF